MWVWRFIRIACTHEVNSRNGDGKRGKQSLSLSLSLSLDIPTHTYKSQEYYNDH